MGKFVKCTAIGGVLLLLVSCTGNRQHAMTSEEFQSYESPLGYIIDAPIDFNYSQFSPSGKYYYFGYPVENKTGMRSVEIHDSDIPACSQIILGTSKTTSIVNANGTAIWGRVDFFDNEKLGDFHTEEEKPICRPSTAKQGAGYALCSEKNGKTVLICISQETDNPTLAKQIFETFRWTK